MNKKILLITLMTGLISFAGSFGLGWFTKKSPPAQQDEVDTMMSGEQDDFDADQGHATTRTTGSSFDNNTKISLPEKQLEELVFKVRLKIQEYENKIRNLSAREERLKVAHDLLKKDIENLNNLRTELDLIIVSLKEQQDKLEKSRITVAQTEKENLLLLAATYDKMSSDSAGKILSNMSKMAAGSSSSNIDDAVKILHYMTERTKAKLLAELSISEPKLAALLCRKLKQIVEE